MTNGLTTKKPMNPLLIIALCVIALVAGVVICVMWLQQRATKLSKGSGDHMRRLIAYSFTGKVPDPAQ